MSQFCGSFEALINRSLLTVILYCAAGSDAVSAVIDTPVRAVQAAMTSLRLRYCMIALSLEGASCVAGAPLLSRTVKILSAKPGPSNAAGRAGQGIYHADVALDRPERVWR